MEMYVFKSIACLAVFYTFYKLLLEKESFHTFKRTYLLVALCLSFIIPTITFTEYVIIEPTTLMTLPTGQITYSADDATVIKKSTDYLPIILWSIYGIGVLIFGIRFGKNLWNLIKKIRNNPHLKMQSVFHVLLQSSTIPHTFLSYVFLNKKAYDGKEIPNEVLEHETIHAKQWHSLDILWIELIQIVFWFNPILYFYKKSIKLNHEFLADRGVLSKGTDTAAYQNILLAYSSNALSPALANSINYSSFKKRFTVMKTQTSSKRMWISAFVLIPLLSILIFSFSSKEKVYTTAEEEDRAYVSMTARSMEIEILEDGTFLLNGISATKETLVSVANKFHQDISYVDRNNILNIHIIKPKIASREDVQFIYDELWDYGFYRLVSGEQEVVRSKGNTPLAIEETQVKKSYAQEYLEGATRNGKKAFVLEIFNSTIKLNNKVVTLQDFAKRLDAYTKDWEETRYTSTYPSIIIKNTPKSFLDKVEREFQKTHYSKANGGLTLIPPPPPAPESPKTKSSGEMPPPPPPPPAPENPIGQVFRIDDNKSTFFYENNKISKDKAIELLKSNNSLNLHIIQPDDDEATVYISKEPIKLTDAPTMGVYLLNIPMVGPMPDINDPETFVKYMSNMGVDLYKGMDKISLKEALQLVKGKKLMQVKDPHEYTGPPKIVLTEGGC